MTVSAAAIGFDGSGLGTAYRRTHGSRTTQCG